MTAITEDSLVLTTWTSKGLDVETFQGRLLMVLAIMNDGAIGGGNCYGDEHHLAAMDAIEEKLCEVRSSIAAAREAESHNARAEAQPPTATMPDRKNA